MQLKRYLSNKGEQPLSVIHWLFNAQVHFGNKYTQAIYWKEIIGNIFGLGSALLGMRRKMWAWPIGIVGNVLLFTLFIGSMWDPHQTSRIMLGQAGRQLLLIAVSLYGWWQWSQNRKKAGNDGKPPVQIRWTTTREKLVLVPATVAFYFATFFTITAIGGSWNVAADSWIFTGTALATYGLARGFVEFWLVWVAVDAVGVPLDIRGHYYPTAAMYVFYGAFVIWGFVVWLLAAKREKVAAIA